MVHDRKGRDGLGLDALVRAVRLQLEHRFEALRVGKELVKGLVVFDRARLRPVVLERLERVKEREGRLLERARGVLHKDPQALARRRHITNSDGLCFGIAGGDDDASGQHGIQIACRAAAAHGDGHRIVHLAVENHARLTQDAGDSGHVCIAGGNGHWGLMYVKKRNEYVV